MSKPRPPRVPGSRAPASLVLLLPSIPDDLDEATKNGLALRNLCATTGTCPACGARAHVTRDREIPGFWHATWVHEVDCPVPTDEVAA